MIILINGLAASGKSTLASRISNQLALDAPVWPITSQVFETFRRTAGGWMNVGPDYFTGEGHVNLDKLAALAVVDNMARLPAPPPSFGADPEAARCWLDQAIREITIGRLMPSFFKLLCTMIDAGRHTIVEGTNLGAGAFDTPFARMILFKYSAVPTVKLTAYRRPYEGPRLEPGTSYRWTAILQGREQSHEELLGRFENTADGDVVVRTDA